MNWYVGLSGKAATGVEAFVFTYPEKPEDTKFESMFSYFLGPYRSKSEAMTELRSGKYLKKDGGIVDRVYVKTDKEMDAMLAKESVIILDRILSGENVRLVMSKPKSKRRPVSAMVYLPKEAPMTHTTLKTEALFPGNTR